MCPAAIPSIDCGRMYFADKLFHDCLLLWCLLDTMHAELFELPSVNQLLKSIIVIRCSSR